MTLYGTVMSVCGPLVLLGIFMTWFLARLVERGRLGTTKSSNFLLLGGIITAAGFITYAVGFLKFGRIVSFLVMFGPVLIVYGLSISNLIVPKLEMLFQMALMVGSIGLSENKGLYTILIFSAVSVLLLIDAVAFYIYTPFPYRLLARVSSWLLVAFTVVNAIWFYSSFALAIYVTSIILWVLTLVFLYPAAKRRIYECVQKSL